MIFVNIELLTQKGVKSADLVIMRNLILVALFTLSACAHRRVALINPRLPYGHVYAWGRVIPVVDGKENYKNCRVQVAGNIVPLDANGIFMLRTREDLTSVRSVTCGNKSVVLPTNYAKIQKNAGPRSVYLGSIFVKFGKRSYKTRNSDYDNRYNTEYMMETNDAEYFAVQNHYARDRALFGRMGDMSYAYKATRSILETPGIPSTNDNNQIADRAPASLTDDKYTTTRKRKNYYNNVDGYSYDYWPAGEYYKDYETDYSAKPSPQEY